MCKELPDGWTDPPDELGEFSYETMEDGYVIYGPNGKKITPYSLMRFLNAEWELTSQSE